MSEFEIYFSLGLDHILDVNGYDHILFVIALTSLYQLKDWKRVLILVTAFTIGHSVTLALSTLDVLRVNPEFIEFLIPITILITAVSNITRTEEKVGGKMNLNYLYALVFGLVHGLGFSNYLKSLLGKDSSIITQLFAFNIGLEVGQIIIVVFFLILSFIFVSFIRVSNRDWKLIISSAVMGIAIILTKDAWIW